MIRQKSATTFVGDRVLPLKDSELGVRLCHLRRCAYKALIKTQTMWETMTLPTFKRNLKNSYSKPIIPTEASITLFIMPLSSSVHFFNSCCVWNYENRAQNLMLLALPL